MKTLFLTARVRRWVAGGTAFGLVAGMAVAGPVVIDGTDANDHGSFNGSVNLNGWEYMQRVLENLGANVNAGRPKVLVNLGANTGTQAGNAISSAFTYSTLPGLGWSMVNIDGATAIDQYFDGTLATTLAGTGILYLPSKCNSSGDLTQVELDQINLHAADIASYVGGAGNAALGGGLFSMAETGTGAFGWLTTLIPGIVFTDVGGGGVGTDITLTAAGTTAFPGLTNSDMAGADPWHGYFSGDLGSLSVLGTALQSGNTRNLIIGGGTATTISVPDSLPSGAALAMVACSLLIWRRQFRGVPA